MNTNWMPAGLGAEPKKVAFLVALVVLLPVAYWYGNSTDTPAPRVTTTTSSAPRTPAAASPSVIRPSQRPATRVARGGTDDFRFRAFATATGEKVWEIKMASSIETTPITHMGADGRQFVTVVSTGGGLTGSEVTNDEIIAFALPKK